MKKLNNLQTFESYSEKEKAEQATDFKTTIISKVKNNDYFRFPGKKTVYVYKGYNRNIKAYEYCKYDDINAYSSKKNKDTAVEIDFTF